MLRFVDGGGIHYTDLTHKYPITNGVGGFTASVESSTNGRWGGRNLSFSSNGANLGYVRVPLSGSLSTYTCGIALKPNGDPVVGIRLISFFEGSGVHMSLRLIPGFGLDVIRAGTTQLASVNAVLSTSAYYYVEIKTTIHSSTGTVDVRVNGVSVISLTGQNTRNGGTGVVDSVQLGTDIVTSNSGTNSWRANDFYITDATGTDNTGFLGDVRIETLFPSANGTTNQWTASTGSNYTCVDETAPNSDTDYVSTRAVGNVDQYAFQDLTATTGTVLGVAVNTFDRKEDGGARTHAHVIYSGTLASGTAFSPSTTYMNHQTVFERRTDGAVWTISDVNGLEAGIKISS